MQAIVTKYIGPSNVRGARIKATADAGSVIVPKKYELNTEDAHAYAALALARKFGWKGTLIMGGMPDKTGYGYVFVFAEGKRHSI